MIYATERDLERVQIRRGEYQTEIAAVSGRLKFLDEAGSNLAMTRLYGRAVRGERVFDAVPQNYGENITMLACLSEAGLSAPMTVAGAVDGSVFLAYARAGLVSDAFQRRRGDYG